jgi:hypothetical protein
MARSKRLDRIYNFSLSVFIGDIMNKLLNIPNLWASLVDWYFNPDRAEWNAKFANEDQERQAIFLIGDLLRHLREYVGADLKEEIMQRGKDEKVTTEEPREGL